MVRDQEKKVAEERSEKKHSPHANSEASRKDQVLGKGGCRISSLWLLGTVEIQPELYSVNLACFTFLTMHQFRVPIPVCPVAGKALQQSSSSLPCFWVGLFNPYPSGKSIRQNWLWHKIDLSCFMALSFIHGDTVGTSPSLLEPQLPHV